MMRFMGRFERESSPWIRESKGWPARMPDSRRIVVPELPASSALAGAASPLPPAPWIRTVVPSHSTRAPSARMQPSGGCAIGTGRVIREDAGPPRRGQRAWRKRCEIDLSPGRAIEPLTADTGADGFGSSRFPLSETRPGRSSRKEGRSPGRPSRRGVAARAGRAHGGCRGSSPQLHRNIKCGNVCVGDGLRFLQHESRGKEVESG